MVDYFQAQNRSRRKSVVETRSNKLNLKNNYTRTVEHSLERDNMMGSVKTIPSTLKENSVIKKKKSSHLKSQSKLKHPRTAMSRKRNYFVGQKPSKSES